VTGESPTLEVTKSDRRKVIFDPVESTVGLAFAGSFHSRRNNVKNLSPNIIDETARFWSDRAKRAISQEDARQIVENITGFFSVLAEWEAAERQAITCSVETDVTESAMAARRSP
jgi:hypothetical protein